MRPYLAYVRAAALIAMQYRTALFSSPVVTLIWILVLTRVWSQAYQGRPVVAGFTLQTTIVYLTLASLQAVVIDSPLPFVIAGRVRTGEVIFDVNRPIGFAGQMLALQAGQTGTQLIVVLAAAPLAAWIGGLAAPAGVTAGLLYPVALLAGLVLNALLGLLIGLSAFWTVDNWGLSTLYRFVAAFLAGAAVPLTFLPGPLRAVAEALPFRFVVYEPAAIYVGQVQGAEAVRALGLAVLWIVVVAGLVALVWRRAFRRVVIHGG
ncbi:ABC-2 family transporter protein [Actinoplanes sp. NPDC051851]|uniref:ABC transporter permease n=1 Tax=Actinoplanes sp. NPDC051851 TaxID=3154753 RepID=UPI003422C9B4